MLVFTGNHEGSARDQNPVNVGFFSYLIACAAYLVLTTLLLISWRGRALGSLAIGASFCTALWAGVSAASIITTSFNPVLLLLTELARDAGWFLFLFRTLSVRDDSDAPVAPVHWLMPAALAVFAGCAGVLIAPLWLEAGSEAAAALVEAGLVIWVVISIIGLLLIEQIYRNCNPDERWGLKFLCIGLGAVFAYDFYMYADALLFKQLDLGLWSARGIVNAIAAPLIAISIARNPKFNIGIHVSRDMVLHSVTVFGAGSYLLLMASVGYFIRFYGGSWGNVLQIAFLFGTGLLLVVLLFSDKIRRRLRVFLNKHFFSYKYNYREEWLKFTQALAETTEEVPERVVRAIATLVSSPGGMLWEFSAHGHPRLLARWNMPEPAQGEPAAAPESLAHFLESSGWVIDIEEYARSPGLYEGLELPDWCRRLPGAWLLVPLLFRARAIGCVLLARSDVHGAINWEDRDLLKTAGLQAAGQLAQYQSDRALVQAQQFEAFNRLSAYVVHDLKNILAQQSLIVSNAEKHIHKPEFVDDVIDTVRNSVARMTRLMEQMRSGSRGGFGAERGPAGRAGDRGGAPRAPAAGAGAGSRRRRPGGAGRPRGAGDRVRPPAAERPGSHRQDGARHGAPAARGRLGRGRDRGHRLRHGRRFHPRTPVQALRFHQGPDRHGHRRLREPRVHSCAGWRNSREQHARGRLDLPGAATLS